MFQKRSIVSGLRTKSLKNVVFPRAKCLFYSIKSMDTNTAQIPLHDEEITVDYLNSVLSGFKRITEVSYSLH